MCFLRRGCGAVDIVSDPWIPDDLDDGNWDRVYRPPIIDVKPDHWCVYQCRPHMTAMFGRSNYTPAELAHRGAPLAWLEGSK